MASYAPIGQASFSSTSYSYSPLLSDGDDIVSRSGTVASGIGILKRGTICKIVPATGVITVGATAAEANCILANDVDATSATVPALVYLGGKFKADAVIWPGALAHADVADALRNFGIFIESVVFTDGTLVKSFATEQQAAGAQAVVESNRQEGEAARKGRGAKEGEDVTTKPSIDSPWAYLTPEEREKNPELAAPPTMQELQEVAGEVPPDALAVTISPASDSVTATAETANFAVTVTGPGGSGKTWAATKDVAWLTIVSPTAPQTASGTVTYAVAANTGVARVGKITVNGKIFTVNQSAPAAR
jgi:hypothetical protein